MTRFAAADHEDRRGCTELVISIHDAGGQRTVYMSQESNGGLVWKEGSIVPVGWVNARRMWAIPRRGRVHDLSHVLHCGDCCHVVSILNNGPQSNGTQRSVGRNNERCLPQCGAHGPHWKGEPGGPVQRFVHPKYLPLEGCVGKTVVIRRFHRTNRVPSTRKGRCAAVDVFNHRRSVHH